MSEVTDLEYTLAVGGVPVAPPRREVQLYAQAMETQLRAHDDRPGWKRDDPEALFAHLCEEVVELSLAVRIPPVRLRRMFEQALRSVVVRGRVDISKPAIRREGADIGNMSMMVVDASDALEAE